MSNGTEIFSSAVVQTFFSFEQQVLVLGPVLTSLLFPIDFVDLCFPDWTSSSDVPVCDLGKPEHLAALTSTHSYSVTTELNRGNKCF